DGSRARAPSARGAADGAGSTRAAGPPAPDRGFPGPVRVRRLRPLRRHPPPRRPPRRPRRAHRPHRRRPAVPRPALRLRHAPSPAPPSPPARTGPPDLTARARVRSPLELQSAFAGAVGYGFDAPVILVAAAVEHDLGDPLRLRFGGDEPPERKALGGLALALDLDPLGRVGRADQRHPTRVVHDLGVDVLRGAEHDQTRPLGAAPHLAAYPQVPPVAAARL